jgi:hypothetical protein
MTSKSDRVLEYIRKDGPASEGVFKKAFSGKASPRAAIKAKCLECTWLDRKAITECTADECPLWHYRPFVRNKVEK